ncbi:hypothetical protein CY34DRAFT_811843 [Suillus luteus UH-Slu-Lm8-n1]|uniref:Uncharacterized protein n=1 Tax=Suillus luteus UH-Slu-Lm8-n1 TaxID=930992 RepID=A0A0D0A264_9AGAM|nr:hypothetical protein CY34DRAFT_811843 [Suillus luteus UH-Slu-Lm8-n1]
MGYKVASTYFKQAIYLQRPGHGGGCISRSAKNCATLLCTGRGAPHSLRVAVTC